MYGMVFALCAVSGADWGLVLDPAEYGTSESICIKTAIELAREEGKDLRPLRTAWPSASGFSSAEDPSVQIRNLYDRGLQNVFIGSSSWKGKTEFPSYHLRTLNLQPSSFVSSRNHTQLIHTFLQATLSGLCIPGVSANLDQGRLLIPVYSSQAVLDFWKILAECPTETKTIITPPFRSEDRSGLISALDGAVSQGAEPHFVSLDGSKTLRRLLEILKSDTWPQKTKIHQIHLHSLQAMDVSSEVKDILESNG
jgi:hypothetical protein